MPSLPLLMLTLLLGAQNGNGAFADAHLSWQELQELGGLAIGEPFRHKDTKWVLTVDCNVAGARAVTTEPTRQEPGQTVRRVSSQLDPETDRIYIWVLAAEPRGDTEPDPECRGAFLGYPPSGTYQVLYQGPKEGEARPLGKVTVPEYEIWVRGRPPG